MRNTRFITAIIAFAGTFAVSVGLVWLMFGFPVEPAYNYSQHNCSQRHSNTIYSHLRRDISNGRERDNRSFRTNNWERNGKIGYSIANHANSIAIYVEDSRSLDVSDFPRDFQVAWHKHIDAWQDYSEFLNEKKNLSRTRLNEENFAEFQNPYDVEINQTWEEVLRLGRNYGADIR